MGANIIDISTFIPDENSQPDAAYKEYGWHRGTVECTLRGKTERLACIKYNNKEICTMAGAFVMKYRTGSKVWKASVALKVDGFNRVFEIITGGFDSRSGKHQLLNNIWFASEVHNTANISKR